MFTHTANTNDRSTRAFAVKPAPSARRYAAFRLRLLGAGEKTSTVSANEVSLNIRRFSAGQCLKGRGRERLLCSAVQPPMPRSQKGTSRERTL